METVKDESADVRTQVALALRSSGVNDPTLLATLHALLRDPDARVRIVAAGALVDLGEGNLSEVLPIFEEGLMHPQDQFAKWISADALGRLGPQAAASVPALRAALFTREPPNEAALDALDRIGEAATPVLAEALTHPDPSLRKAAAHLVGRKGDRRVSSLPLGRDMQHSK
jgi:HEAT repeat protein